MTLGDGAVLPLSVTHPARPALCPISCHTHRHREAQVVRYL